LSHSKMTQWLNESMTQFERVTNGTRTRDI
jgi:hypothetical protein